MRQIKRKKYYYNLHEFTEKVQPILYVLSLNGFYGCVKCKTKKESLCDDKLKSLCTKRCNGKGVQCYCIEYIGSEVPKIKVLLLKQL